MLVLVVRKKGKTSERFHVSKQEDVVETDETFETSAALNTIKAPKKHKHPYA